MALLALIAADTLETESRSSSCSPLILGGQGGSQRYHSRRAATNAMVTTSREWHCSRFNRSVHQFSVSEQRISGQPALPLV